MTPEEKIELAGNVITYGKALAPDRFPRPTEQVVAVWADVLGSISVPKGVWPEAVRVWAVEIAGERMCTPRELKQAARAVLARWESEPVKRELLAAHREARRVQRDRELSEGRFGEVRGHARPVLESRPVVSGAVLDAVKDVVKRV
ncbi:hypothetical protein [Corynebacterium ureicelerivorans]|uniref:Uncharacterized protein n=1 Tax=Corynebacterium ureicelerivorans TaxID=401472 RepID=A0A077HP58_9CORY|nr:hypothetical protein [Corynebacterium ureicelerivorans]AIL96392.1 hypothetical protein CUREI_02935 [Corynebacterium ureicelerivorans]AIL97796.1 hypothetical protein CUREI_11470 [Corynebacterium ureicelerivorans]